MLCKQIDFLTEVTNSFLVGSQHSVAPKKIIDQVAALPRKGVEARHFASPQIASIEITNG